MLFACLALAGANCTKSRAVGVDPSYGYKGSPAIGSLLGQPADVEGKRPGIGADDALWATGEDRNRYKYKPLDDALWATAEDRNRYKPLVVALARQDLLLQHPGVVGVRAGYGELRVYTMKPILLPPQLWGVPIKAMSPSQCPPCAGGRSGASDHPDCRAPCVS